MLLRALSRATTAASSSTLTKPPHSHLSTSRLFSANTTKANLTKAKKSKFKSDGKDRAEELTDTEFFVKQDEELRRRQLAEDENNPALDVGPNGRPLFTSTCSISLLTKKDACSYMKFSVEELNKVLPEGLPMGMVKEFEESSRSALLIRQSFLDLRDNYRRAVDPSLLVGSKGSKAQKQIVLDGPVSCGKSIALAMLVHWAREEGWLVLYVPSGREWTHGGLFYKNPWTGLWDTPVQAANILQDFSKYNESLLKKLKCNTLDPIPLGEGAGVGWPKGIDKMQISEDSTLNDLVQAGINNSHAAVGVLVRLRTELSDVKDIPVLIAIDQYNSWFTFSEYEEPVTVRSCQPVHARELATVNAFRSMLHENDMMVGAFSHSTAVGKLQQELPDVPTDARINFPRYNLDEAASVSHYYLRQRLVSHDAFLEENWKKIYYLSNGNGSNEEDIVQSVGAVCTDEHKLEKKIVDGNDMDVLPNFVSKIVDIIDKGEDMESRLSMATSKFNVRSIIKIFLVLNSQRISGLRFFEWVRRNKPKLHMNADVCSLIIDNCGCLDDYETMNSLLEEFKSEKICLTHKAFGFLAVLCSTNDSLMESTGRVVNLLNEVGGSSRNSGICSLIEMFCKSDSFEMAKYVMEITEKKLSYYNILIRENCRRDRIEDAHGIITEMRELGCVPNVKSYNYLLGKICRNDRMDDAYKLLEEMNKSGTQPDASSFEVIIHFLCNSGKVDLAYKFLDQMTSGGLEPLLKTHTSLVKALFVTEKYKEAHKYVVDSSVKYKTVGNIIYSFLANLHREKGDIMSARNVLVEMMEKGLTPNFISFINIVKRLKISGRANLAVHLKGMYSKIVSESHPRPR